MQRKIVRRPLSLACRCAAVLLSAVAVVPLAGATYDAVEQTNGGIRYVSGGVGLESIEQLSSMAGDFNLKLVFALASGKYLSDLGVVIKDESGTTVLDTTSEGPWLLTRLSAGSYQVVATFAGNTLNRRISVGADKLRTVDFRWASE